MKHALASGWCVSKPAMTCQNSRHDERTILAAQAHPLQADGQVEIFIRHRGPEKQHMYPILCDVDFGDPHLSAVLAAQLHGLTSPRATCRSLLLGLQLRRIYPYGTLTSSDQDASHMLSWAMNSDRR